MPAGPTTCLSSIRQNDAACPIGLCRAGSATLELVLSMPILLALIVGIVWLGSAVIAQTEVTIEARHKAWSKRSDPTGTALLFLKDDVVSDQASQTVSVSPIFDDTESPESSHDVMASAWDFEKLPMDEPPNWKLYALAAANAKTAGIQTGYVDARNQFAQFQNDASNIWNTLAVNLIRELTGLGDATESALEGAENGEVGEKARERDRINRDISGKKNELRQAREDLRNLDDDATDAQRQVLKNRVDRLESELEDLEDDLEAID